MGVDGMPVIERPEGVPRLTIWQCPECGELHLDRTGECAHECSAEMVEVEIVEVRRAR